MLRISYLYFNFSGCPELVKSTIFPSTANEVDKQYVCVTLEAKLPDGYPDCEPIVQLRNPRGLDDSTINNLYESIKEKCSEFLGQPVIFELIEVRFKYICSYLNNIYNYSISTNVAIIMYTYMDHFMILNLF